MKLRLRTRRRLKSARARRLAPWSFPDGNTNRVVLTVQTNNSADVESKTMYTSFSLLKSMEGAFRLPCLNHACDSNVNVMSDLFDGERN